MSKHDKTAAWPLALLPMLISSITASAWAQSSPPSAQAEAAPAAPASAASAPADKSRLESVVVTAQRTRENLQKIPVSVTALTPADLENRQIISVLDVAKSVPNLTGAENTGLPSASSFFLRGIGQDESIATSDPAVGTYIDGVYVARQVANNAYLYDVERIEVLRGPQGTLYGRNTSGGAISIITQKPSDTLMGNVRASYGNYGRWDLRGSVGGPIADRLTGSVAAYTAQQDKGFQNNITTGERAWDRDSKGARGALRFRPTSGIDINFSADYSLDRPLPILPVNAVSPAIAGDRLTVQSGGALERQRVESTAYTLNVEWLVGGLTLKSITGYRDLEQKFRFDLSDNPTPAYVLGTEAEFKQFSQEFNAAGKTADNALSWVGGLFFMDEQNETLIVDDLTGAGIGFPPLQKNLGNDTKSYAVYVQGTYRPIEKLGLTLGGRYTREEREVDVQQAALAGGLVIPVYGTADVAALGTPVSPTYTAFTPKMAVDYAFTPDLTAFASFTKGFKSGGWNGRAFSAADFVVVRPEKVKSYEAGVKSEWLDRRLRLNATYFYADYTDLIVTALNASTNQFVTNNAARAAIQGLEVEAIGQVTGDLRLNASLGTMDGKYKELDSSVQFPASNDIKRVPKLTYRIGFDYETALTDNYLLTAGANYAYTARMFNGVDNTPFEHTEKRRLLDVLVSIKDIGRSLTLFAGCRNCTDQRYFHSTLAALGFASQFPGEPRTFNVGVNYDFGR